MINSHIKIKRIGWAAFWGILFSLVAYWTTTIPEPLLFESFKLSQLEKYNPHITNKDKNWNDSVTMIDVHYDKIMKKEFERLYSRIDEETYNLPIGDVAVTDHSKLLTLLKFLQGKNYKYIILDIILDDDIPQECDDSLRQLISQMPRLLIPTPDNNNLKSISLMDKSGEVSYFKSKQEFSKYPYFLNGTKSLPLKMYEGLHGHNIIEHSFASFKWYTDKGLCTSSIFLTYQFRPPTTINEQRESSNYDIYHLGLGLLYEDSITDRGLDDLDIENKYVLIGDYESDIHHTFVGDMSGTAILFNAYLSLVEGKHHIGWHIMIVIFLLLSSLSYYTLSINPFVPKKN